MCSGSYHTNKDIILYAVWEAVVEGDDDEVVVIPLPKPTVSIEQPIVTRPVRDHSKDIKEEITVTKEVEKPAQTDDVVDSKVTRIEVTTDDIKREVEKEKIIDDILGDGEKGKQGPPEERHLFDGSLLYRTRQGRRLRRCRNEDYYGGWQPKGR